MTTVPPPKDATIASLRPERLVLATREAVLPGTVLALTLRLEGQPLALQLPVEACLVVGKDRSGYQFHVQLDLNVLGEADRHLIALFITKGRGSPDLGPSR